MTKKMNHLANSKVRIKFMNVFLYFTLISAGITLAEKSRINDKNQKQLIQLEQDLNYINENPITITENQTFSICTINVQNKYTSEESNFQSGADLIISLVEDGVDIIGTQEMKSSTEKNLEDDIENYQYDIVGEPRWGDGIIGDCLTFANETNSIIGSELYMSKTVTLPWVPQTMEELLQGLSEGSIMSRIVTCSVCAIDGIGYVRCYNTHLDYGVPTIQRRQMDALLELIDCDNAELELPIVITGDFNAEPNSENMKYFIEQLSQRGIQLTIMENNTYKGKIQDGEYTTLPKQLDYVFYSNDFQVVDYQLIDNPSSDHDAVLIKLFHPEGTY